MNNVTKKSLLNKALIPLKYWVNLIAVQLLACVVIVVFIRYLIVYSSAITIYSRTMDIVFKMFIMNALTVQNPGHKCDWEIRMIIDEKIIADTT